MHEKDRNISHITDQMKLFLFLFYFSPPLILNKVTSSLVPPPAKLKNYFAACIIIVTYISTFETVAMAD